ncbi:hypothetical protein ACDS27_002893 [Salmonella enterica]
MDSIFSPVNIGKYRLESRVGLAPMSRLAHLNSSLSFNCQQLLINRAASGCSVVTTEAMAIKTMHPSALIGQPFFYNSTHANYWSSTVNKIRKAGALPIIQLNHSGRLANNYSDVSDKMCVSSSDIKVSGKDRQTGMEYPAHRSMSDQDINDLINSFILSAQHAVDAGFIGIELNCAHGYLLNQFLSSRLNNRVDRYGGDVFNRFYLISKIVDAIRQNTNNDVLLSVRLSYLNSQNHNDFLFNNENDLKNAIGLLRTSSLDIISLSTQEFDNKTFENNFAFTRSIRKYWDRFLFSAGGIHDLNTTKKILEYADVAMIGKSLLLMPQWIDLLKSGWPLYKFSRRDVSAVYGNKYIF